jgi:hypothetical protein
LLDGFETVLTDSSNSNDVLQAEFRSQYWQLHQELFLNQVLQVFDFYLNFQEEFEVILQPSEQAPFFTHHLHFQIFPLQKVFFLSWLSTFFQYLKRSLKELKRVVELHLGCCYFSRLKLFALKIRRRTKNLLIVF